VVVAVYDSKLGVEEVKFCRDMQCISAMVTSDGPVTESPTHDNHWFGDIVNARISRVTLRSPFCT
jgi:hypothetical protein